MEERVTELIPCLILSCLQHNDAHFYFKNELKNLRESDIYESIGDTVMHFYIAYDVEYKSIIERIFVDPLFMKSKSRFMAKIGSKCLQMSKDPTFFNFLLMCAFVGHVASFCYEIGKCYRVVENTCKCAVAVFNRKYLEFFDREDGLKGLWQYCDCLNKNVLDNQDQCDDLKDILTSDPNDKQLVLSLLNKCKDLDSTEFFLTNFERRLLYKVTIKRLKKLKSGLDCLMYRIPRKYFQILKNGNQNIVLKVFSSNLADNGLNQQVKCSLTLSPPIEFTMKIDSDQRSNCCSIKKQSEPSDCSTSTKPSELSDCSIFAKPSEPSDCSIFAKQSEQPDCFFVAKKFIPSDHNIVSKHCEPSNFFNIEEELELPNINKQDSEFLRKQMVLERSSSSVCNELNREKLHSTNYKTFLQESKSAIQFSQMLKYSHGNSLDSEMSEQGGRLGSSDSLQTETSLERDASSTSKTSEITSSPQDRSPLATDFCFSKNQFVPTNLCSDDETKQLRMSFPLFKRELPDTKKYLFELKTESSKKYWIPPDVDNNIQSPFTTSSSNMNDISFKFCKEEKSLLRTTNFLSKNLANISHSAKNHTLARVCQGKPPFTATLSEVAPVIYKSDQSDRAQNKTSKSSFSNETTSSSVNQHSSDGYLAGESNTSDTSGNEEFQFDLPTAAMTYSNNLPSESDCFFADEEGGAT